MKRLSAFGIAAGHDATRTVTGPEVDDPVGDGRALIGSAELAAMELDAVAARRSAVGGEPGAEARAVLGEAFVIAPVFAAPDSGAFEAALTVGARPGFLDGDAGAPLAWLHRVSRVRETVSRFTFSLLCAVAPDRHRLRVAQLPAADRWIAMAFGRQDPPAAATSLVIHTTEPIDPRAAFAGLLVDEWVDVVPARTVTTGLTFHFDEPGSRAPHAILLAVPPAPTNRWSLDTLAAVVGETADLARIRMVGPEEAPWFGRIIPALYFADNRSGDTIHVDFHDVVERTST
jgi:hypothetical protein